MQNVKNGILPKSMFCMDAQTGELIDVEFDDAQARLEFPLHQQFMCEGVSVWITHIGGYPNKYNLRIKNDITKNPPKIFISGHSHILKVIYDKKLDLLHLNPGAAGKHGFQNVRTMLRFEINDGNITNLEIIELEKR